MMNIKNLKPLTKSSLLLTLGLSIFGFADNLTLLVSDSVSVGQFHFTRSCFACLFVVLLAYSVGLSVLPRNWKYVAVRTLFNVLSMLLYFSVIPIMPIAEAGAGLFTSPVFVLIFSYLLFQEKILIKQIFCFITGLFGVLLILWNNFGSLNIFHAFPVLAGATYALGAIITHRYLQDEEPLAILISFLTAIGISGLFITMFFTYFPVEPVNLEKAPFIFMPWQKLDMQFLLTMGFLGFAASLAIYCIILAYQISKPSFAAIYEYSYLISAGFFSWVFWEVVPGTLSLFGILAIVTAGVILAYSNYD